MSDAPHPTPCSSSSSPLPRSLQVWRGVLTGGKAEMAVAILRTPGFIKKRTNDDDDDEAEAMIASFQSPSLRFVATVATSPTRGGCFPLIKLRTRVLCKEKVHPPFPASHFPSHHLPQPFTDIKSCASLSHSPTRLSRVYREAFLILFT